jgi:hypothetical protein
MDFWNRRHRGDLAAAQAAGCYERHLQRRRQNPLFPKDRQDVSLAAIQQARQRDNDERSALRSQIVEALRPLMEGPDSVDGQMAIGLLQEIHQLIERACQCDQGLEQEVAALQQGYQSLSESIRIVRGSEHSAQLDAAAHALQAQIALLSSPLLATLCRPDSPMRADELVPSFISLPVNEIGRCLEGIRALSDDLLSATVSEAIRLIGWASQNGVHIPDAEMKLHLLQEVVFEAG